MAWDDKVGHVKSLSFLTAKNIVRADFGRKADVALAA